MFSFKSKTGEAVDIDSVLKANIDTDYYKKGNASFDKDTKAMISKTVDGYIVALSNQVDTQLNEYVSEEFKKSIAEVVALARVKNSLQNKIEELTPLAKEEKVTRKVLQARLDISKAQEQVDQLTVELMEKKLEAQQKTLISMEVSHVRDSTSKAIDSTVKTIEDTVESMKVQIQVLQELRRLILFDGMQVFEKALSKLINCECHSGDIRAAIAEGKPLIDYIVKD